MKHLLAVFIIASLMPFTIDAKTCSRCSNRTDKERATWIENDEICDASSVEGGFDKIIRTFDDTCCVNEDYVKDFNSPGYRRCKVFCEEETKCSDSYLYSRYTGVYRAPDCSENNPKVPPFPELKKYTCDFGCKNGTQINPKCVPTSIPEPTIAPIYYKCSRCSNNYRFAKTDSVNNESANCDGKEVEPWPKFPDDYYYSEQCKDYGDLDKFTHVCATGMQCKPVSPADANVDGLVNIIDRDIWKDNYLKNIGGRKNADFNNDGKIDGIDYVMLWNNYAP